MSWAGYLTGRYIYLTISVADSNATASTLQALFPVYYNYSVFFFGYRFCRTDHGAERILTMVTGSGKVG